jgi:hypothetical protein
MEVNMNKPDPDYKVVIYLVALWVVAMLLLFGGIPYKGI